MDFTELWESRGSSLELLLELEKEADASRDSELSSCVSIQKIWRGHCVWARIAKHKVECGKIQRMLRGIRCRASVEKMVEQKGVMEADAVRAYFCVLLQKSFRGAYSRKYRHDFAARKAYLESVVARGEELRREGELRRAREKEEEEARAREEREREFAKLTKNRHHLVSTKAIPGVYDGHTVKGVRVESYLCSVKDLLERKRPRLRKNLDGVRKLPVPFDPDRRSIQASTPYESSKTSSDRRGGADFRCGQRVHLAPYQRGVNGGSEFFDPWQNPLLKRGVDVSSSSTAKKHHYRVFCSSVGGNKSYVRPNGLFDEILRAEHHGGVTRRQLAVSQGRITKKGDFFANSQTRSSPPPPPHAKILPHPPPLPAEDSCLLRGSSIQGI